MFTIFNFFSLLCGLSIFLYGMQQSEKSLRRIGGSDLRRIITSITRHRLSAYLAGLGTTLVTQSSSATTVILVSFASANLMTAGQSLGMILGADLGTTFTVQLFAFKFYEIAPLLIAVGFFVSFLGRQHRFTGYGKLILSCGFIFFGMQMMSQAIAPLRSNPVFEHIILSSLSNPWYGLLAGTVITSIIHSSAATLAIVITLGESFQHGNTGWVPMATNFFPLVLGANIGTCATALISMIGAGTEGVRVAWAHLIFKVIGTALVFPVTLFGSSLNDIITGPAAIQIALLHTIFAVFISILFLPLSNQFGRLIVTLVKPSNKRKLRWQVNFLNDNILKIPTLALSQSVKEIERISQIVAKMVEGSRDLIKRFNFQMKNQLISMDDEIDFLHEQTVSFLTRLSHEELQHETASKSYELVMVTTDLEHIGDIVSKSIIPLSEKIEASPLPLSQEGKDEIIEFFDKTIDNFKEALAAFTTDDIETAQIIFNRKAPTRALYEQLCEKHLNRLYLRKPETLQTTSIHFDLLEEIQRINHFTFRITARMLKIQHTS
jgi:phosphate:Na+ symporter